MQSQSPQHKPAAPSGSEPPAAAEASLPQNRSSGSPPYCPASPLWSPPTSPRYASTYHSATSPCYSPASPRYSHLTMEGEDAEREPLDPRIRTLKEESSGSSREFEKAPRDECPLSQELQQWMNVYKHGIAFYRAHVASSSFRSQYKCSQVTTTKRVRTCNNTETGNAQAMEEIHRLSVLVDQTNEILQELRAQSTDPQSTHKLLFLEATHQAPIEITCPLTKQPMMDPVIAADGYFYDRPAIQKLLGSNELQPISPVTHLPYPSTTLQPSATMKSLCDRWRSLQANPSPRR